jgi:biotin carboxylase
MNYVYFSPHFPPNYYHFCVALKKFGANVLGLGDEPWENLRPELKSAFTEYYRVENMHNYSQLIKAMGYLTWKHGKINGIDSNNEYWLETEAKLRTDFNIEGIRIGDLGIIKQKSRMKQVFSDVEVSVARGRVIDNFEDAVDFVAEVGYPVVAKPDSGVGAANTFKVNDQSELKFFFETKPNITYILEEFIRGEIESFDGLTDRCGNPLFITAHSYDKGVMMAVNDDLHISYHSLREIPRDIEEAGRKILKAFRVKSRFFHFEFFRLHDTGKLVALEVNMRPPGGFTTDMFNFACDFDIYQEWASVVLNNRMTGPYVRKYHVCYVGRKFTKKYVLTHSDVIRKYASLLVHHDHIAGVLSPALGNYAYIIRHKDLDVVLKARDEIQKMCD